MISHRSIFLASLAAALLAGCGTPSYEKQARDGVAAVARNFRPTDRPVALPVLAEDSPAGDYLRFALLKHPRVEAAFYEWRASVEAITPARSQPDPQLSFEADITDMVMTAMPGFMFDFMGRGKRAAMGREAAAASAVAYRDYVTVVLNTATAVRKAWVELDYAGEAIALRRQSAALLEQAAGMAQADYVTGRGMASLEKQTNILNESAKLKLALATLEDRRDATRARFKAALGLRREEADPAWPAQPFPSAPPAGGEALWRQLSAANPQVASMRAMVDMAVAAVVVARRSGSPDFTAGLMADVKASPLMLRPTATMTLPIWRDKIAAVIASADARRLAAEARLNAEQIAMSAELAQMLFMVREADRMIAYIDGAALPSIQRALASAGGGYEAGMGDFATLAGMRLMELDMRLERAGARRERESALADLSLLVAGDVPADGLLITSSK
ncbi:MAG: TolC family protein [Opitutaceae bacterium]|jgi:outer membrane protein TolC|nr:TolC family protein [Opitutaceae bacterium]